MRFSAPIAVVLALAVAPVLGRPRGIYDGLHARSWEDSLEARVAEHAFRLRAVDHGLHARDLEYALYAREADQDDLGARDLPAKAAKAVNRVKDALHLGPLKDNPEVPHLQALAAAEAVRKYGVTRAQADADRRAVRSTDHPDLYPVVLSATLHVARPLFIMRQRSIDRPAC
jgi:hypothetical protein